MMATGAVIEVSWSQGRVVAKANSSLKTLTLCTRNRLLSEDAAARRTARPVRSSETEPALNVVIVYQDPLTRHWATDLWDRVGQLIDSGGICRKSWKLSDLARRFRFRGRGAGGCRGGRAGDFGPRRRRIATFAARVD